MTEQEEKYFEALIKDREENLSVLGKPSMRGIWKSVVEKYADEAHFVYELLQNADDVSATRAEFILSRDKLIFKHNGKKKFSISNPVTEELDTGNSTLGDINSITSIGNSIKTAAEIGKFGVGFKAVFRYTAEPAIFEKNIAFRLKKIIVPERLPERGVGDETVFEFPFTTEFPFGIKGCLPADAYDDISKKLLALNLPTLFLSSLQEVKFSFGSTTGLYKKEIQSARTFGETTAELLKLTGGKAGEQNLWLFSRKFDGKNYSVGYFMESGRLKLVNETAFCFFPTKRETKLKFIIHAPFLLNDSREQILAGDAHNKKMIDLLAVLAADSLVYLRELGLIDDGILEILPLKESDFDVASDLISFKPFFTAIRDKMRTEKLLPTRNGYVTRGNAYWAEVKRYADVFSDEQLRKLVGNPAAAWVFTTISRRESDKDVRDYVDSITRDFITEENLFRYINASFIENQPIAWFERFYDWLAEQKANRIPTVKTKLFPFFLDADRRATAAFDEKGEPILFLPSNDAPDLPKIHPDLLANPKIEKFLRETIGLKEPSLKDEIYHKTKTLDVKAISKNCIETAPIDWAWLHKFYKWLSETTKRTEEAKTRPLFLDTNFKAVAAFDSEGKPQLFLQNSDGYPVINDELLKNSETDDFLKNKIGISYPSLKDEIQGKIRPLYATAWKNLAGFNDESCFKKIFDYYKVCQDWEVGEYIEDLKQWIYFRQINGGGYDRPKNLYMPESELIEYFGAVGRSPILNKDFYLSQVDASNAELLHKFFEQLGVTKEVRYSSRELEIKYNSWQFGLEVKVNGAVCQSAKEDWLSNSKVAKFGFDVPEKITFKRGATWKENFIAGCPPLLNSIVKDKDAEKSFILWKRLVAINETVGKLKFNLRNCKCEYFFFTDRTEYYETYNKKILCQWAWLVDRNGDFKKPADITVDELADGYDVRSIGACEVIEFLGFSETPPPAPELNLSAEQKNLIELGKILKDAQEKGIDVEKLIAKAIADIEKPDNNETDNTVDGGDEKPKPLKKVSAKKIRRTDNIQDTPPAIGTDDFKSGLVDYGKKLENAKTKSEAEEEKIKRLAESQQKVLDAEKYSFGWCKALLELEILKSNENKSTGKEVSISFRRVERDLDTQRTLILKYPNRYIPQFMEDLENIPLVLRTAKNEKSPKKVEIEVAGIRHNTLSVKLKDTFEVDDIDLSEVIEARIDVNNPIFLLDELQKQFNALGFADDYNMRDNLCANIEFVFGPPGTGKTTHLADKIRELMDEPDDKKILVLTPTNKAADVLVNKIIFRAENDSYLDWLLRFGTTDDKDVEKSGVFHDKTYDITSKRKNVTVTTIARFPYDFFMPPGKFVYLREMKWDYIIIDEASMIMLAQILLPLYTKTQTQFIIAGDPFQIEPVTMIDLWKGENIYTLVELNSFTEPKTRPHDYTVTTLNKQYRSLPAIGRIFSRFAYGGILEHARADSKPSPLNIDDWLEVQPLNIIKFPVEEYESIYRSRYLGGKSSYQIYSALFTFEFVRALRERIDKKLSIGIISPYRAQADLIEKLFASTKCDVQIGTIHTFQGDECDILIAVFNTPPTISNSPEMFLNRLNIINVAISRARDYLFIVMPDENTDKIENLRLIRKVENLFANEGYGEFSARDIEESLFGNKNYIEENSFATGHQNVNVYARPERKYEIRSEDNAVDVQLHEKNF